MRKRKEYQAVASHVVESNLTFVENHLTDHLNNYLLRIVVIIFHFLFLAHYCAT